MGFSNFILFFQYVAVVLKIDIVNIIMSPPAMPCGFAYRLMEDRYVKPKL